jgi:hypothetical protein
LHLLVDQAREEIEALAELLGKLPGGSDGDDACAVA